MSPVILWNNQIDLRADGYAYAAKNITTELRKNFEVITSEHEGGDLQKVLAKAGIGIGFKASLPKNVNFDILVNNLLPCDYEFHNGKYHVGFSYWETTQLPSSWISNLNRCDEVWTTSKWAVDVFKNSGVTVPVYNFDLGVRTDIFRPKPKTEDQPFTFLHVGSPSTRKNTQLVVDAFLKLFKNNLDYRLIIKSNGPPDARVMEGRSIVKSLYECNNIIVKDSYMTDNEISMLFSKANCMVYPTRGEGWGMAPFQTIACGTPTICTNQTACTEFAFLSVPLEAELTHTNLFGIYEYAGNKGQWADPKLDDVCDKMLYVINNYDDVLQKTINGAKHIADNYSWPKVAQRYADRIKEIAKTL